MNSSSICVRGGLIEFKIVHRLHMSKIKLSKIFPGISSTGDRCKRAPANLYTTQFGHVPAWQYSALLYLYSKIAGRTIEPYPFPGLIGVTSEGLNLTKPQLNTTTQTFWQGAWLNNPALWGHALSQNRKNKINTAKIYCEVWCSLAAFHFLCGAFNYVSYLLKILLLCTWKTLCELVFC